MILALALACSPPDASPPADETDVAASDTDTDPPEPADTDVGTVFEPAPGVFLDEASPSWFEVKRQSVVCRMVVDGGADAPLSLDLIGMDDGTVHRHLTGVTYVQGPRNPYEDNNIEFVDDVLYQVRGDRIFELNVRQARWSPSRDSQAILQLVALDGQFTDGHFLWDNLDDVGSIPDGQQFFPSARYIASDGDALYGANGRAGCGIERLRGPQHYAPCLDLPRVRGGFFLAFDVVGLEVMALHRVGLDLFLTRSDNRGRQVARYPLPPAYAHHSFGLACEPGPL